MFLLGNRSLRGLAQPQSILFCNWAQLETNRESAGHLTFNNFQPQNKRRKLV